MGDRIFFITAIGGDIGSSVLKHVRESYPNDKIVGCDIMQYNQGIDYVDLFFVAPAYSDQDLYWEFIQRICKEYNITHFLPMAETEIKIADANSDYFKKNDIKLMVNSHNLLEISFSKYDTVKYLERCNLNVPETWKADEDFDKKFPLVVKGNYSCGSKYVKIVNNEKELQQAIDDIPKPIIQSYIGTEDEEYTMAVFSDGHRILSLAFKRKLGYGGMSVLVELVRDPGLDKIAKELAEYMSLCGSINIQLRKQDGEFYVFEINPRISSTIGFRYKLGFKDDIWWIKLLDGESEEIAFQEFQGSAIGVKVLDEKVYTWGGVFNLSS